MTLVHYLQSILPPILDGVHPNKRMYAKWSETVGKKLCQRIKPQIDLLWQKQQFSAENANNRLK